MKQFLPSLFISALVFSGVSQAAMMDNSTVMVGVKSGRTGPDFAQQVTRWRACWCSPT